MDAKLDVAKSEPSSRAIPLEGKADELRTLPPAATQVEASAQWPIARNANVFLFLFELLMPRIAPFASADASTNESHG
jgi:hypothetical protein